METAPIRLGKVGLARNGKYKALAVDGRRMYLHRYVMETHIGRPLLPSENVHHKNGDTHDNRLENLEILQHGQHSRITRQEHKKPPRTHCMRGHELTPANAYIWNGWRTCRTCHLDAQRRRRKLR